MKSACVGVLSIIKKNYSVCILCLCGLYVLLTDQNNGMILPQDSFVCEVTPVLGIGVKLYRQHYRYTYALSLEGSVYSYVCISHHQTCPQQNNHLITFIDLSRNRKTSRRTPCNSELKLTPSYRRLHSQLIIK